MKKRLTLGTWSGSAALVLALILAAGPGRTDEEKYADPDSPQVKAAARAALAHAQIKDIVGISKGIDSTLSDLGAKITDQEIRIELSADVLFDFDKYNIRPDAETSLQKVAEVIQAYPKSTIKIVGFTDSKGSAQYNLKLSENRANSVKDWLVKNGGISASRITTVGLGAAYPVASNTKPDGSDDAVGRQKNRRVEIRIQKNS